MDITKRMKGDISMTGRDLIAYIILNGLEDKPVFEDGKFVGMLTIEEVATQMNVSMATVNIWIIRNLITSVKVGNTYFIPVDYELIFDKNA